MTKSVSLALVFSVCLIRLGNLAAEPQPLDPAQQRANELVQLALQAELTGDHATRTRLLQDAIQHWSDCAPANWHLNRVQAGDEFHTVQESIAASISDEDLQLFRKMRDEALGDPNAEEKLARHCARLGLPDQSKLFYYRVSINPAADRQMRLGAMKKLRLKPAYGGFLTRDQIRERELAEKKHRIAFAKWLPKLRAWHKSAASGRHASIDYAIQQISEINDKQIVSVADSMAAHIHPRLASAVVHMLRRHPEFEATQAITRYAVLSPSQEARIAAIQELNQRRLHDFVPLLLSALVAPIESRWAVEADSSGNIHYSHQLYQENQANKVLAELNHVDVRKRMLDVRREGPDDDRRGLTRTVEELNSPEDREREFEALAKRRDEQIEQFNKRAAEQNERAAAALEATTNQRNLDVGQWRDWWERYNQTYVPRPTQYLYKNTTASYLNLVTDVYIRHSCFIAGTPVWTDQGLRPIESIQIGDRVLSQDVDSGELSWKLVIRTTAGESASTHIGHLQVNGESIFPTLGHVVWVNGKGWKITGRVEHGDLVHTLSGSVRVTRRANQSVPKTVYNLVVPDTHTYFVGKAGILVHDITTRQPTLSLIPGLTGLTGVTAPQ